jgi:type IV pilus assembly protein PilC
MSITFTKRIKPDNNTRKRTFSYPAFLGKKRFNDNQKSNLYADLHLLISSGLDIKTVFDILLSQAGSEWERKLFGKARERIILGDSIATAMLNEGLAGNYEYHALVIGEESGKLTAVLGEIKRFYERKIKQRRQVVSALTYPVIVLFTAIIAVGFMLNFIVPMFVEVFKRFQGSLPPLTQKIILLSDWMKNYALFLVAVVLGLAFLIMHLKKKEWYKRSTHFLVLKIPLFGKLIKNLESAKFCHIMALLTGAHSPLVQSLNMVSDMIGFFPLKKAVENISLSVESGETFYRSIDKSGFFDKKFVAIIRAAEEVNKLEYAFNQLNEQYNQEIDHKLSVLGNLMEPLLIIFVGVLVAIILIAMYLPLFQIGTSII